MHIPVVTRFNVFTCPCHQVNHGSLSTTHAYAVSYPFDCVSLLSAFRISKTIFRQMLATTEQKPNLAQSTLELGTCVTFDSHARFLWHCHQTNVCGCLQCTDSCGFGSVWSRVLWKLHLLGLVHLALISDGRIIVNSYKIKDYLPLTIIKIIKRSRRYALV